MERRADGGAQIFWFDLPLPPLHLIISAAASNTRTSPSCYVAWREREGTIWAWITRLRKMYANTRGLVVNPSGITTRVSDCSLFNKCPLQSNGTRYHSKGTLNNSSAKRVKCECLGSFAQCTLFFLANSRLAWQPASDDKGATLISVGKRAKLWSMLHEVTSVHLAFGFVVRQPGVILGSLILSRSTVMAELQFKRTTSDYIEIRFSSHWSGCLKVLEFSQKKDSIRLRVGLLLPRGGNGRICVIASWDRFMETHQLTSWLLFSR